MTLVQSSPKKIYIRVDEQGWQPGANTVAYYPLTQNANDYSGNNYNITTSGASSYTTDGALLPDSNHAGLLIPFNINTSNNYTFSYRCKPLTDRAGADDMRGIDCTQNTSNRLITLWALGQATQWWGSYQGSDFGTTSSFSIGTRYYITCTINSGTINMYFNGGNTGTKTGVSGHTCALRFGQERNMGANRRWYGYMKDIIIENKARTAQEISDYYDRSKGNYGIQTLNNSLNNSLSNTLAPTVTPDTPNSGSGNVLTI